MKFAKRQIGYLLLGLIFWLPIAIAVAVGSYILGDLEEIGKDILGLVVPDRFLYTGLGVVLWVLILFTTGLVLKFTLVGRFLSAIPIVGAFFRSGEEIMTLHTLMHLTPCLFLYSPTCLSYGWILSEEGIKIGKEQASFKLINVYYPNVPTLLTGQVFTARKETVMRLGNSSREVIDVLLYSLRRPEDLEYLPWEGETEEELKERAKRFGLS